jgi:hypothetical protein
MPIQIDKHSCSSVLTINHALTDTLAHLLKE